MHLRLRQMVRSRTTTTSPSLNIDLPVFVINLRRDHTRWDFLREQVADLRIPLEHFQRVEAVDGSELVVTTGTHTNTYQSTSVTVDVDVTFGTVERNIVACTVSHIRAIHLAYDSASNYAVIAEDDVSWLLSPFWKTSLLQLAEMLPQNQGATITLFTSSQMSHDGLCEIAQQWGTQAYIINREAMATVLTNVHKADGGFQLMRSTQVDAVPADSFIYQLAGAMWSVSPTYIYPYNCTNGSTLHGSHDTLHMRQASRALCHAIHQLESRWLGVST